MTDFYVAFSIAGSNCFITANRTSEETFGKDKEITIDGFSFRKGESRTHSKHGATKLLWNRLTSQGVFGGDPMTDPHNVHAAFMLLRERGWKVDDKDFVKKHGIKPAKKTVEKIKEPVETKTEFTPETPPVDPMAAKMSEASDRKAILPEETPPDMVKDVQEYRPSAAAKTFGELYKNDQKNPPSNESNKPVFENLDGSVTAVQGDITTIETDVMVNAANAQLIPGGGVDGAINKAAGPKLGEAMADIGGTITGNAVMTTAYNLPAKFVTHAVGPVFEDYPEEKAAELLKSAYMSAFTCAASVRDCKKVTVPLLSTGVYGYPMDKACAIAVQTARQFNSGTEPALNIIFVAFDDAAFAAITAALAAPSHE